MERKRALNAARKSAPTQDMETFLPQKSRQETRVWRRGSQAESRCSHEAPQPSLRPARGLFQLASSPLPFSMGTTQHPSLNYLEALTLLKKFKEEKRQKEPKAEPLFVWISHPNSHTKINPTLFFSWGFSFEHTLFLESHSIQRTVSYLTREQRALDGIILDGYAPDRVLLQLARRWLKPHSSPPSQRAQSQIRDLQKKPPQSAKEQVNSFTESEWWPFSKHTDLRMGDDVLSQRHLSEKIFIMGRSACTAQTSDA